jgi:putative peptidoglycan lipid II flippase
MPLCLHKSSMTARTQTFFDDMLDDRLLPELTPEQTQRQEETNARVAGATGILVLGNIASRVLGLMRETMLTFLFGASAAVDAFQVAIIVPRAIYDLLIGGHINGALIPVLSEIVTLKGRHELWRVVSILMSLVTAGLALLVLVIELFAPQIVHLTASGSPAPTLRLAAELLRLTAPALIFMGLFAVFSAALYALKSFTLPAFAGLVFNGSIVIVTLLFVPGWQFLLKPTFDPFMPVAIGRAEHGIVAAAVGWLVGAVVQMALQLPGLRGGKLQLTFNWRHPALRSIAMLYAPVMFSLIMDTLIIRPFSYNLASHTGNGSIAYMTWATTLIQFPQGLVATAISLAILPTLASQAAVFTQENARAFKDTLGLGLRLATTLIIPAALGLFVLAEPIIGLLFEHGAFKASDTGITALALRLYLVGLPFAAIDLLLVYAFYARKDTLTPAIVGVLSLVIYMVTAVLLLPRYGLFSLMIADSVKHVVHAVVSGILLRHRVRGFARQRLVLTTVKTLGAAFVMALVGVVTLPFLSEHIGTHGLLRETLLVLASGGLCSAVFLGVALWLRIEELRWIASLLKRKVLR